MRLAGLGNLFAARSRSPGNRPECRTGSSAYRSRNKPCDPCALPVKARVNPKPRPCRAAFDKPEADRSATADPSTAICAGTYLWIDGVFPRHHHHQEGDPLSAQALIQPIQILLDTRQLVLRKRVRASENHPCWFHRYKPANCPAGKTSRQRSGLSGQKNARRYNRVSALHIPRNWVGKSVKFPGKPRSGRSSIPRKTATKIARVMRAAAAPDCVNLSIETAAAVLSKRARKEAP